MGEIVQLYQKVKEYEKKFDNNNDKKKRLFLFLRLIPGKKYDIIPLYYLRESTVSAQISVTAGF